VRDDSYYEKIQVINPCAFSSPGMTDDIVIEDGEIADRADFE